MCVVLLGPEAPNKCAYSQINEKVYLPDSLEEATSLDLGCGSHQDT